MARTAIVVTSALVYYKLSPYMSGTQQKNPERVAAGLKGTLKNANVSEEAKERASERLQEMGVEDVDREPLHKSKDSNGVAIDDTGVVEDESTVKLSGGDSDYKPMNVLGHEEDDDEYEFQPPSEEDDEL